MFLIISKTLMPCLAVFMGVFRFQYMAKSTRLIFFQAFAYLFLLALTKQVMVFQRLNNQEQNTSVFYNIYLPLETVLLLVAAFYRDRNKYFRGVILLALSLFFISFGIELF